jgi:hypothetical protein
VIVRLTVGLLANDCLYVSKVGYIVKSPDILTAIDVESELQTIDGGNLALTALVRSADDHDLVLKMVQ